MNYSNKDDSIRRILIDAGCDDAVIERFIQCSNDKQKLDILAKHRIVLPDIYHRDSRKIECLDFLVNKLKKGQK